MKLHYLLLPALMSVSSTALADPVAPAVYVAMAGASDLYERTASQVVLKTTTNPQVKAFATMMVTDHHKSTAMVKAAAAKSHIAPAPPALTPEQRRMIADLRAQTGTARDTTYIAQQKTAHSQALVLQQSYANEGTAPALKAAAVKIVPVVAHHIQMLDAM